jgi:hypothetical protein
MNLAASVIGRSDRVVGYGSTTGALVTGWRGSYAPDNGHGHCLFPGLANTPRTRRVCPSRILSAMLIFEGCGAIIGPCPHRAASRHPGRSRSVR